MAFGLEYETPPLLQRQLVATIGLLGVLGTGDAAQRRDEVRTLAASLLDYAQVREIFEEGEVDDEAATDRVMLWADDGQYLAELLEQRSRELDGPDGRALFSWRVQRSVEIWHRELENLVRENGGERATGTEGYAF